MVTAYTADKTVEVRADTKHPQYLDNYEKWCLMKDILQGDVKMHALPQHILPAKSDPTYKKCKANAEKLAELGRFLNFTLQTRNGLVNTALSKPGIVDMPEELDYLITEASGNKLKLDQLIVQYIGDGLCYGRAGGYVDYPSIGYDLTEEDRKARNINPRIYYYSALQIFNWDTDEENGTEKATFIVLDECHPVRNGFKWEAKKQLRVLELEPQTNGKYIFKVSVVDEYGKLIALKEGQENPSYPKKDGANWEEIPFVFFGSNNNNSACDYGPIQPIAHINIGHYRNSCSYEDNLETHGQCTATIHSSLPRSDWERIHPGKLKMGSKEVYYVGEQGGIDLVQCAPAPEIANAMHHKEEQMIALNAYVMLPSSANAPVETTRMHASTKTSILGNVVTNVEDGIRQLIIWCGQYKGIEQAKLDKIIFNLNKDFIPDDADPAIMRELAAQNVQSIIPRSVVRDYDRRVKIIPEDVTDEDLDAEIAREDRISPIGMGFNTNPRDSTNGGSNNDKTSTNN